MKYIRDSTDYQIHVTVEADNTNNVTAEQIKNQLEQQSSRFEPYHKSSRSMWPYEELIGVSIAEADGFSGKITEDGFRLSIDDYGEFNRVYEQLKEWVSDTEIDTPQKQLFKIASFSFVSTQDNQSVTHDSTKSTDKDDLFGSIYTYNGIKSNYSMIQGMLIFSILEPEDGVSMKKFDDYLDSIIQNDLVLIGATDEIIDPED